MLASSTRLNISYFCSSLARLDNNRAFTITIKNKVTYRWVELDRPLKKQLDKFAQDPYLYLGVMFYVNDVSLLEDEVTR